MTGKQYRIYQTRLRALLAKKQAAKRATLGVEFTTLSDFVQSIWGLYGDGRKIIDAFSRTLIVSSLLDGYGFLNTLGTADLISGFLERTAGKLSPDNPLMRAMELTDIEKRLIDLSLAYESILFEMGLIELGSVLELMKEEIAAASIDYAEDIVCEEPLCRVFSKPDTMCKKTDSALASSVDMQCLFSAGSSITWHMIANQLRCGVASNECDAILLATDDVVDVTEKILRNPSLNHVQIEMVGTYPFSQTRIGRVLCAIERLLDPSRETDWVCAASDFAQSIYAGISPFSRNDFEHLRHDYAQNDSIIDEGFADSDLRGVDMNTLWRSDRTFTKEDALRQLCELSDTFYHMKSLFESPDCRDEDWLGMLYADASTKLTSFEKEIELAALAQLQASFDAASFLSGKGLEGGRVIEILLGSHISFSCKNAKADTACRGDDHNEVISDFNESSTRLCVMSYVLASQMSPDSFDLVVIDDVSEAAFNAKRSLSSLDTFEERIGCARVDTALDAVRQRFSSIVAASRMKLVCAMSLLNKDAQEVYSSFVFDELIAEVSERALNATDLVELYTSEGVVLMRDGRAIDIRIEGEENLVEGVGAQLYPPQSLLSLTAISRGNLADTARSYLVKRIGSEALPVLSASAIETYLGCPYRWFIERRVKPSSIDESLSALERGVFAHKVMEVFFGELIKDVSYQGRLALADDAWIETTFDRVYESLLLTQRDLPPLCGRYIPIGESQETEQRALKRMMLESIKLLKAMPQNYACHSTEFVLDAQECQRWGVTYAGSYLNGKIDRIDVDEQRHSYCVIDYKGSNKDHDAGSKCFEPLTNIDEGECFGVSKLNPAIYPLYVQTLIYAGILKKLPAIASGYTTCSAALYVGYLNKGKTDLVSGSWAANTSDFSDIASRSSCVTGDFDTFLCDVENLIAYHVERLCQAYIETVAHDSQVCFSCIYRDCEARQK